jgi:hypothetical protein
MALVNNVRFSSRSNRDTSASNELVLPLNDSDAQDVFKKKQNNLIFLKN